MTENQLSRYGAIAKALPLMSPAAKVFFLAPSTAAWFGDFQQTFPPDKDGFVRVHTTIASVISNGGVVASRGDVVVALPGYTETITAVQSLSVAGVQWIGIGEGTLKPTIQSNSTTHTIGIAANNVVFKGWRFPAPSTDAALSMIRIGNNVVGARIEDIVGIGSNEANNFVHCITVGSGANDHILKGIELSVGAVAVTAFLNFEGPVSRSTIGAFRAIGSVATAGIIDATGAIIENAMWDDLVVAVGGSAKPAVTLDATQAGSGGKGVVTNSRFAGTHTTLATNAVFTGDYRLSQVFVSEETGNVAQGALIPAADTD